MGLLHVLHKQGPSEATVVSIGDPTYELLIRLSKYCYEKLQIVMEEERSNAGGTKRPAVRTRGYDVTTTAATGHRRFNADSQSSYGKRWRGEDERYARHVNQDIINQYHHQEDFYHRRGVMFEWRSCTPNDSQHA